MLAKRIIPCLDIKDGRTVKGVNFFNLKDAGDPIELAVNYSENNADELVFLDISATEQKRKTLSSLVYEISKSIDIPFTVGGGIESIKDVEKLLKNGADKISINSSAIKNPNLINELSKQFGNQCIVVAVDAKLIDNEWKIHLVGGKVATKIDLFEWVLEAEDRGAGEILFTSMDHDGTKSGFAINTLNKISSSINIPLIASGGAGENRHFIDVFKKGNADAALAASVFHYGHISINKLKKELRKNGIIVR